MRTSTEDCGSLTRSCFLSLHFVFLLFAVNENRYRGSWRDDKKLFSVIAFCLLVVHSPVYFVLLFAVIEMWYGGSWKLDKKLFAVIVFCLVVVHSPVYLDLLFAVRENWYEGLWKLDKKLFAVIVVCLLVYSQSMRTGTKDHGRMTRSCLLSLYSVLLLFTVQCIWTCCLPLVRTGMKDCGSLTRSCLLSL